MATKSFDNFYKEVIGEKKRDEGKTTMTIRLVYYSEELDTEVTVYVEEDIDIEELEQKNCIFTGGTY